MTASITAWVRKSPVLALYILSFLIIWLGWVPQAAYSHGLFPFDSPLFYVLGGVGPLLAVFIVLRVLKGGWEFGEPFRPFFIWRVGIFWYFVSLFGYYFLWLATVALRGNLRAEFAGIGTPGSLLAGFLISFVAAIPESVAWRGFALPRLQTRYNAFVSSLIVGVLWALWHLPLLLNQNNVMSTYPLPLFFIDVLARAVIYTWIYNNTRGSLLFVTLFHAASNTAGSFVGFENILISYTVAAILVAVFGAVNLTRQGTRQMQDRPTAPAAPAD